LIDLSLKPIHKSWLPFVETALDAMDPDYQFMLASPESPAWLPGPDQIFNAFSLPLDKTKFILLGESPYPRAASANGYAFIDNQVEQLWSDKGLSKTVNRATSLRNLIKMLLLTDGYLSEDNLTQAAIASLDKQAFIDTGSDLRDRFHDAGILLLNATLVFSGKSRVRFDAKHWEPFVESLLKQLAEAGHSHIHLILLGAIAKAFDKFPSASQFPRFTAEHPYNLSFITNPEVQSFFRQFKLLTRA